VDVTIAEGYDNDWRGEGKSAAPGPLLSAVRVKRETVIFYLSSFVVRRNRARGSESGTDGVG